MKALREKNASSEFLTKLLIEELGNTPKPDALIFAGPKAALGEKPDFLKEVGPVDYPVFYVNYDLDPGVHPWTDLIGKTVRASKATSSPLRIRTVS